MPSPFDSAQRRAALTFSKAQRDFDLEDDEPDDEYQDERDERLWAKADHDFESKFR